MISKLEPHTLMEKEKWRVESNGKKKKKFENLKEQDAMQNVFSNICIGQNPNI